MKASAFIKFKNCSFTDIPRGKAKSNCIRIYDAKSSEKIVTHLHETVISVSEMTNVKFGPKKYYYGAFIWIIFHFIVSKISFRIEKQGIW